jgi:glyoxylase-like metal-dependent hydrolase (beta-lactamase superfamily II)
VLPIVEAKRAQLVKSDFALNESIQFVPTPGHTIDHYSVLVGRPGQDALITGDMIHSPIQARYPELGMRADHDSRQAGQTRLAVAEAARRPTAQVRSRFPGRARGGPASTNRYSWMKNKRSPSVSRNGHAPSVAI